MGKTRTFGVRLTPQQIAELERLRDAFAFSSYGELMENWIQHLQRIDTYVSQIQKHPRDWTQEDVAEHLGLSANYYGLSWSNSESLMLRRLRERFGEDGLQSIQNLWKECPMLGGNKV